MPTSANLHSEHFIAPQTGCALLDTATNIIQYFNYGIMDDAYVLEQVGRHMYCLQAYTEVRNEHIFCLYVLDP